MKRLLFTAIIALGRALRVVAVPLAMMLSCVAIGQQLAPVVARPTPAELAFGAACVALGVLGIGWVRWQTDATVRELIGWVLGFRLAATSRCRRSIENLARFQTRWTDGVMRPLLSRYAWLNAKDRVVRFFGDEVEFQNGFGAWQRQRYQCDFALDRREVIHASVEPGRLD